MPWPCILLETTNQARVYLRRFASGMCHNRSYHNMKVLIDTATVVEDEQRHWSVDFPKPPHEDPRWPRLCECGYAFAEWDAWQVFSDRLYRNPATEALLTWDETTPGMIREAPWYTNFDDPWMGPDGKCLVMRLPGRGEWVIDGPATGGGRWTRTGEVARMTVRPSILSHPAHGIQGYHGWVTEGMLSDDLVGRTYPGE